MGTKAVSDSSFTQAEDSKNVSQLVRSNSVHYWSNIRKEVDLSDLKGYLSFEGVLAGDPHMGNFAPLPLKKIGGSRGMVFVNVDFDDAGLGPFVLDYIRYEIAAKAASKVIKKNALQLNYLAGLSGNRVDPPKLIQNFLQMSTAEYDYHVAQYTADHTTPGGFKTKPGAIEPYKAKIAGSTIDTLFPGETVVDLALRPRERGGSADKPRVWVLVEDRQARRRIMELKQFGKSALERYRSQPPVKQWLAKVREAFWPGLDGSAYDLIDVSGAGLFWIREKHFSLVDVPYSSTKPARTKFLFELANYDAYQLGLAHARQGQSAGYRKALMKDLRAFREATSIVEKAYLKIAKKALREELEIEASGP
jgi:hypothetical protein